MATKIFAPLILFVLLGAGVAAFWRDIVQLDPQDFRACTSLRGDGQRECLDRVLSKMKDRPNWSREEALTPNQQSRWVALANDAVVIGSMAAVPKLYLQCADGWAEVGVDWGLALPEQSHLRPVKSMMFLEFGIDALSNIKDYWRLSEDRKTMVSRTSVALLRDIAGHRSLMFSIKADGVYHLFANFSLVGIDEVVADLRSRCRTTLLPT
ncbi:hypothetical protein [Inquilinus limosus]|uniref:hypothetical protein n=1 Tax=Inquilinus limosus TaxID=171674 RepID=UPI0004794CCA|nr:hypothetical protein [Inquilinus limosus]